MSFTALPVDLGSSSFKRWAVLSPDNSTVYDPPPDALWIAGSGDLHITGSDDVDVILHFGSITSGDAHGIFGLSPKKVPAASQITPIGLWKE